jgi:hypothetical protein
MASIAPPACSTSRLDRAPARVASEIGEKGKEFKTKVGAGENHAFEGAVSREDQK